MDAARGWTAGGAAGDTEAWRLPGGGKGQRLVVVLHAREEVQGCEAAVGQGRSAQGRGRRSQGSDDRRRAGGCGSRRREEAVRQGRPAQGHGRRSPLGVDGVGRRAGQRGKARRGAGRTAAARVAADPGDEQVHQHRRHAHVQADLLPGPGRGGSAGPEAARDTAAQGGEAEHCHRAQHPSLLRGDRQGPGQGRVRGAEAGGERALRLLHRHLFGGERAHHRL
mmetsp:Transcript_4407/g.14118  ORF Transcript_4407/g.14118 Transcript_4407/m.14118 type:complete len:223 (-) Transcript_4407:1167-1835(-)